MNAQERFLHYVSFDTQSDEHSQITPSSLKQLELAEVLVDEMKVIGIEDAYVDESGVVYGMIPATTRKDVKSIGFIAHMDTSSGVSGRDVEPRAVKPYDGSNIVLNEEPGIKMGVHDSVCLQEKVSKDLIVTDGTTPLGTDDKAEIAGIITMAGTLLQESHEHGKTCLVSTPDGEVGRRTGHLRISEFGTDIAYTIDGGEVDCVGYENLDAVSAKTQVQGLNIHPGSAKGKMINALLIVMEFHSMLPVQKNLAYTEGYESFHHLTDLHGECEYAYMSYIIRNRSEELFEQQGVEFQGVVDYLDQKYPESAVQLQIRDSYVNIRIIIEKDTRIIELTKTFTKQIGLEPRSTAIRGGTDGARLAYDGLLCPSLEAGGYSYHGGYEFTSIQEMQESIEPLLKVVESNMQEAQKAYSAPMIVLE